MEFSSSHINYLVSEFLLTPVHLKPQRTMVNDNMKQITAGCGLNLAELQSGWGNLTNILELKHKN